MKQFFKFFFVAFVFSILSQALSLKEVQKALENEKSPWKSGTSSIIESSRGSLQHLAPLKAQDYPDFDFTARPTPPFPKEMPKLPSQFDWRNIEGAHFSSPILHQGFCGSCTAFAVVGALETQMKIANQTPNSLWAFSPQHLFSCGGGGCALGMWPDAALKFLKNQGIPDEACFPYKSGGEGKDFSCNLTCSDANQRSSKILNYPRYTFMFAAVDELKKGILKGPVVTTMKVYEDFGFYKGGIYKHVLGKDLGLHSVALIGWDDSEKVWIARNSWGEDWGEKGYFRLHFSDDTDIGRASWGIEVAPSSGYVTLGGIRDYQVLRGSIHLELQSTVAGTKNIELSLLKNDQPLFWDLGRNKSRIVLDTTQFPDGVYSVLATADTEGGPVKSQLRTLYLLNGPHQGQVEITHPKNGDTVSDLIRVGIKTSASPIPFTSLYLKVTSLKTGEEKIRSVDKVFPEMVFNWNTKLLEPAEYQLSLEARVGDLVRVESQPITVSVEK